MSLHAKLWRAAPSGVLTTGIGSLPHPFVDAALNFSFSLSIPFLPQIPIRNPREFMIGQALEGLPGLSAGDSGFASLDEAEWEKGTAELRRRTDEAFALGESRSDAFAAFEPSPSFMSCWLPFLHELEERGTGLAKIQIAGPMTSQWVLTFRDGTPADRRPDLGMQIYRLVLARAVAMVRRLRGVGVQPLIFLDEPGFYGFSAKNPRHGMALQELKLFIQTLKRESALVGIHCCSNTDWAAILGLPLDVLSIDTTLSLNLLLTQRSALTEFLRGGGRLSLGVVPTGVHAAKIRSHRPEILLERLLETLNAHFENDQGMVTEILATSLFTPACGLALHSIEEAEAIRGELVELAALTAAYLSSV